MGTLTGWRHRLPRTDVCSWQDWSHPRPAVVRKRIYRSALTGNPVEVMVPTAWGRVAMLWRGWVRA